MTQNELFARQCEVIEELCSRCVWDSMNLAEMNGIAFEVYPWFEYCALSFRMGDERNQSAASAADWKLFEHARTDETSAFQAVAAWYGEAEVPDHQLRAHRIFCASAQAALDHLSTLLPDELRETLERAEGRFCRTLELMVTDVDQTFGFNYCEHILACRYAEISIDGITKADVDRSRF